MALPAVHGTSGPLSAFVRAGVAGWGQMRTTA
jgi:hypothetical protein